MKKVSKLVLTFGGLTLLGACAEFAVQDARGVQPGGGEYDKALYGEYLNLAETELKERDFSDAIFFAERAKTAGMTTPFNIQKVSDRMIPAEHAGALGIAYDVLTARLAQGAAQDLPIATAQAVAAYECWLQEAEENLQPEDIVACEEHYVSAMDKISAFYRPAVAEAPAPTPAPAPAPAPEPEVHMETIDIYFAFDSAELSGSAVSILADVAKQAMAHDVKMIIVEGFTDTKGDKAYNDRLAAQRAQAVADALIANGIPATGVDIASFGENRPKIETDDGVEQFANRVVTLDFLK